VGTNHTIKQEVRLREKILRFRVEDFCSFCPTLPGLPCHHPHHLAASPVTTPVTLPLPLSLCQASPVALSVPLSPSHVRLSCIHELEFVFIRPNDTFVIRTWEGYFKSSDSTAGAHHVWTHLCSTHLGLSFDLCSWHAIGRVLNNFKGVSGLACARDRVASRLTHLFVNLNRIFLCCFVTW